MCLTSPDTPIDDNQGVRLELYIRLEDNDCLQVDLVDELNIELRRDARHCVVGECFACRQGTEHHTGRGHIHVLIGPLLVELGPSYS